MPLAQGCSCLLTKAEQNTHEVTEKNKICYLCPTDPHFAFLKNFALPRLSPYYYNYYYFCQNLKVVESKSEYSPSRHLIVTALIS